MRRRNILIGTLAIVVVVATIGNVADALHARAQAQADAKSYPGLHGPVSVVCLGPIYSGITGIITGRNSSPAIQPRTDCTPSFTQQDVRDYVAHGRRFLGPGTSVTGRPTVTRVVFLTIRDLGRMSSNPEWYSLGKFFVDNFPQDMLVCYAGLSGTFTFAGGIDPPSHESAAFLTFDAHTGNELVTGLGAPLG
jgi:hypothetical protein